MKFIIPMLLIFSRLFAATPNDSLVFKNGNILVGEIKSMDQGVVILETDYSDSDFQIEWDKIYTISTTTTFLISLSDNKKYYGTLKSLSQTSVTILTIDKKLVECNPDDIVFFMPIEKSFLDRLYASIDIGFSLTKANNLKQLTSRSKIGYRAEKWIADATFDELRSTQDDIEPIQRSDGKINYRYILPKIWYVIGTISLSSNTEQKLDLRRNIQLGLGRFITFTNSMYWAITLGINRNVEYYSNETPDRKSYEGMLTTELNLYNIKNFHLLTHINAFPGITEKKRFRADFTLDTKYDLPYDFYIKIGFTLNYDNQPAENASETDYVLQTGFGWEWD